MGQHNTRSRSSADVTTHTAASLTYLLPAHTLNRLFLVGVSCLFISLMAWLLDLSYIFIYYLVGFPRTECVWVGKVWVAKNVEAMQRRQMGRPTFFVLCWIWFSFLVLKIEWFRSRQWSSFERYSLITPHFCPNKNVLSTKILFMARQTMTMTFLFASLLWSPFVTCQVSIAQEIWLRFISTRKPFATFVAFQIIS